MGIERELLASEKEVKTTNKSKKGKGSKEKLLADPRLKESARIRGFLEINPYVCSGCGSTFQSKDDESPGFLPKEKLQNHRGNAVKIRQKQDAIRILEMAGIDLDSATAEDVLTEAKIPAEIISSVRAIGASLKDTESSRRSGGRQKLVDEDRGSGSVMGGEFAQVGDDEYGDDEGLQN
jgi:hypothetical protein